MISYGDSQGANVIFLVEKETNCRLISWQSKIMKRLVHSTLAGESMAIRCSISIKFVLIKE